MNPLAIFTLLFLGARAYENYDVIIHTGDRDWSGTGAKVYIQLFGERGSTKFEHLKATTSQLLVGSVDKFTVQNRASLGKLTGFILKHDNTGSHPGWFVKQVDIINRKGTYSSSIYKWLSPSVKVSFGTLEKHPSCGVKPTSRIINGVAAKKNSWPWMAYLESGNLIHAMNCGGTLINPQYVATAAHCVSSYTNPGSMTITLGDHLRSSTESSEQYAYAESFITHPGYVNGDESLPNDISIIKLTKPVVLNENVKLICLPDPSEYVDSGKSCQLTGWGLLRSKSAANALQQATLRTTSTRRCRLSFGPIINSKHLCAKTSGKSACSGDSGGPLQCIQNGKYYLQGITSFGAKGCKTNYPSVFTRVAKYMDWIESVVTSRVIES